MYWQMFYKHMHEERGMGEQRAKESVSQTKMSLQGQNYAYCDILFGLPFCMHCMDDNIGNVGQ